MKREDLINNIFKKKSCLCVGLDPDLKKIPKHLTTQKDAIFLFNKEIIDATAQYCIAYKPNVAFYEILGTEGWDTLARTIDYIKKNYPDQLIIADAKRGDIGNTSQMYARTFFETLNADAVTVAPYMGRDSVIPFLEYEGKWTVLLALTSNNGASDFELIQDRKGLSLYESVILKSRKWGTADNLMYVIGATKADYLQHIRLLAPENFLLVPGVGAQGGSLADVMKYGKIPECGLIINSSRGIIYASSDDHFAEAAADASKKVADEMAKYL